jgi:hypothetical protein
MVDLERKNVKFSDSRASPPATAALSSVNRCRLPAIAETSGCGDGQNL